MNRRDLIRNTISLDDLEVKKKFIDPALQRKVDQKSNSTQQCPKCRCTQLGESGNLNSTTHGKAQDLTLKPPNNTLVTRRITIAGGFLDIALFSANCEQLKFVLELGNFHIYYYEVLGLIITSLVLQLLVGFTLFLMGCYSNKNEETYSNVLNHITMGLVAIITVVNIFISTFGPKGTVMARCLGAFAYPNVDGPLWKSYLNFTLYYMADSL